MWQCGAGYMGLLVQHKWGQGLMGQISGVGKLMAMGTAVREPYKSNNCKLP